MRFKSLNSYQITLEKHKHFLLEERNDPVTGDSFLEGDEVVFCSVCKSAFLKDSWEYMGNKHCDQKSTLPIFPQSKKLILQKPIELPFVFVDTENRSRAFFLDIFVLVAICCLLCIADAKLRLNIDFAFYCVLSFILFMFRDSILINKSIGKLSTGLYFIDTNTNFPATFWQTLGRNLLYWIMNGIFVLAIVTLLEFKSQFEDADIFLFFIGITILTTNIYYIKHNLTNNYSWFDKLLGIRLVKKK